MEGGWWINDQMTWYIKKGQTISSTEPILFPFYRTFTSGNTKTVKDDLIVCDHEIAPTYHAKARKATRVLCTLVSNLDNVPPHLFQFKRSEDGELYQRLDYELGMQIESGGLKFDLRVDGVTYGDVTASFDSD